jgi:DNA-binding MarR family transcriptional regulator
MGNPNDLGNTLSAQAGLLAQLVSTCVEPHLKTAGISPGLFELLSTIQAAENGTHQADLARRLGISSPSLCEAVRTAVGKGLVAQSAGDVDRRMKQLKLTVEGRKAIAKALQAVNQLEREMVENLDTQELRTAVAVLKKTNLFIARRLQTS